MAEQITNSTSLRILVIAAHPDDIEFDVAGTIAQWVDEGANLTYCIITNGAGGSNDPSANLDELARIRQTEQRAAAKSLGVQEVIFLDYPDGTLLPSLELRHKLTQVIRKVKPYRVVCQDPTNFWMGDGKGNWDYINHPDHRASAEVALAAIFPSAETRPIFPDLAADGYEPHHVNEVYLMTPAAPNFKVDISKYMERKIAALLCHKSQVDSSSVQMVYKYDGERGEKIGCQYAEYFQTIML